MALLRSYRAHGLSSVGAPVNRFAIAKQSPRPLDVRTAANCAIHRRFDQTNRCHPEDRAARPHLTKGAPIRRGSRENRAVLRGPRACPESLEGDLGAATAETLVRFFFVFRRRQQSQLK